jgi:hypothetical protein
MQREDYLNLIPEQLHNDREPVYLPEDVMEVDRRLAALKI